MTLEEKKEWANDGGTLDIVLVRQNNIIIELLGEIKEEVSNK